MPDEADVIDEDVEEEVAAGLRETRLNKVAELRARGIDPYPTKYDRTDTCAAIRERHGAMGPDERADEVVRIAGRVLLLRTFGKLIFATVRDASGEIQLFVSEAVLGAERHAEFADLIDRGDWVGVEGVPMTTKKGELSIEVHSFMLLAKAIRSLPDKWKGLSDTDTRYRQRYVDLITNEDTRRTFEIRHKAIDAIRAHLNDRGYVEVETPALSLIQGGATAKPFITHYNALNIDTYLRIALELNLKRLVVGGMEKVYEIGRVFRNEGIDTRHNPEFTMIEAYEAFADYHDMMDLTEALVVAAAQASLGTTTLVIRDRTVDLAQPWRRATMSDLVFEQTGKRIQPSMPVEDARAVLDELGVHWEDDWGSGKLLNAAYDEFVEAVLIEPTFVIDHPKETSPLAKPKPEDNSLVERFELVVDGRELANAYSELNDPVDQLERFEEEASAKAHGDDEAGDVDLDYIRALEYGLPPTGGLGIGIDRLAMLLAGQSSIREVILFPTLRPEHGAGGLADRAGGTRDHGRPEAQALKFRGSPNSRTPIRVRVVAALVAAVGALYLLSMAPLLSYSFENLRDALLPLRMRSAGTAVAVLIGVSMLYLARQILRRKRRAWIVTFLLTAAAVVVHVTKDLGPGAFSIDWDDTPEIVGLILLLLLLWIRPQCNVKSDPPSWIQAIIFLPTYFGIVIAYGCLALFSQGDNLEPPYDFGASFETVLKGVFGVHGTYHYRSDLFGQAFPASLLILGVVGIVVFAFLLFRPVVARPEPSDDRWKQAEHLVRTYGWDTLAAFDLRPDKSFFFSSDGEAMIAYAYLGRTALVSADPVGNPHSIDLVIDEFLDFTERRGWDVAFLAVREAELGRYHARGLHSFYLGDEAIIHCRDFTLSGPAMKSVRQAVNRVDRDHDFELIKERDAAPEVIAELNDISARWRAGNDERGFTMTLGEEVTGDNDDFLLAIARDKSENGGRVLGFLRIVPAYGDDRGYTLDLMRHDPDAPNGMTEYLTAQTALALKGRGYDRLSMNFASWGKLWHEDYDFTLGLRIMRWFVERLNPYFQIKSLYDFNEKFNPEWLPRSIVLSSPLALPRVGILFGGVEGFVSVPGLQKYFVPKVVNQTG